MDLVALDLPGIPKIASGKVREIFDLGNELLFVATDRLSAFDVVLPDPIPNKGAILTQLSNFWFEKLDFVPNHLVTTSFDQFPEKLKAFEAELRGRSVIVKKAVPLPVECVARGYLIGSGWKEYQDHGTVGAHPLPPGLRLADRLPETLFTPATKAQSGHDENISWKECRAVLGDELALQVRNLTIELYETGRAYAASRGILIADTKFEFGLIGDEVVLIDECLTPDSSRFWPADTYEAGTSPFSFDKQYVRDYLETLDWDKKPPGPQLPAEIAQKTSEKYLEAYERLTGLKLA